MKKSFLFAALPFIALLTSAHAQTAQTGLAQHNRASSDSYYAEVTSMPDDIVPNHLSGVHVAMGRQQVVRAKEAAVAKRAQLAAESTVQQVAYAQGEEGGAVQLIEGTLIEQPSAAALNVTKPTPNNSVPVVPTVPAARQPYIIEAPIVAPIEVPQYAQPFRQTPSMQPQPTAISPTSPLPQMQSTSQVRRFEEPMVVETMSLDPYANRTRQRSNSLGYNAAQSDDLMQHVTDRFSPGGEPFAFSVGRADRNFFGVDRQACCDEWNGFCNCGGLKFNQGHLGVRGLRSQDNCEQCGQRTRRQPCRSAQNDCGCSTCRN